MMNQILKLLALTGILFTTPQYVAAGDDVVEKGQRITTVIDDSTVGTTLPIRRAAIVPDQEYRIEQKLNKEVNRLEKVIGDIESNYESRSATSINELRVLFTSQQVQIEKLLEEQKTLQYEIQYLKDGDHSGWISVLLGCVAILVTVLGVVIALISIIGYRNFKEATTEAAEKIAKEVAADVSGDVTKAQIPEIAKKELARLIDDGELKEHLEGAVDMIVRRNLVAPEVSGFSKYPEIDEEGE